MSQRYAAAHLDAFDPPIDVAILGATGTVGQRFVERLQGHPWFRIAALVASPRSAGRPYRDACTWRLEGAMPAAIGAMTVRGSDEGPIAGVRLALSALDSSVAGELETCWADAGVLVVSNASSHRMDPSVPLVVPEVNADHLDLVSAQGRSGEGRAGGGIVCNPNCSTIGLVLALAPLHRAFGVERLAVTTLQAASGAGYPGVPALDLVDNVVPYIEGEEDKLAEEPAKILGALRSSGEVLGIESAAIEVSAQCFRVPVVDGHTASLSVGFRRPATREALALAWADFTPDGRAGGLVLPSAVERPVVLTSAPFRPQPRLDRDAGDGMTVTVGRLRECAVLDWRFVALSHNTIRGAAGGALLVAEQCVQRGLLGTGLLGTGLLGTGTPAAPN